jgi:hypothetical protein
VLFSNQQQQQSMWLSVIPCCVLNNPALTACLLAVQVPAPGDVFLYPVAEGAFVPTRVAAIGEKYVELDANYGVTGAPLQLEVRLVGLQKQ